MPLKGELQPEEAKGPNGTISRGTRFALRKRKWLAEENARLLRALHAPSPAEIVALREGGLLSESVAFYADVAAGEIARLRRAVEGEPVPDADGVMHPPHPLSAQRISRLGRAQRLLTLGLALEARALLQDDREAASSAGTLIGKADMILVDTLGLDPPEHAVPDLATYLRDKDAQKPEGDAIVEAHVADHVEFEITSESAGPRADGGGVVEGSIVQARSHAAANDSTTAEPRSSGAEETRDESNTPT